MSAQAHRDGTSTPPVYDSLTPRRTAGPGAQGVGQGLTATAAPTPDPYSPSVSPAPVYGFSCPQSRSGNLVDPSLRRNPLRVALLPRRVAGLGAHSVGHGLTVTAAPTPTSIPPVCHRSKGAVRQQCRPRATSGPWLTRPCPQCWPRANCDGCAYLLTVTHSLLPRPQGRALTVSAEGEL